MGILIGLWLFGLPSVCLYICFFGEEILNTELHLFISVILSIMSGAIAFGLWFLCAVITDSDLMGIKLAFLSFYILWIAIGIVIRKKRFFEAFWFSSNGANTILMLSYLLCKSGEM